MTGLEPPPPPRVCARVGWCRGKDTGFEVCSAGFICQACSIQAIWKVSGSSFETRGKEDLVYMAFANEIRGWIKNIWHKVFAHGGHSDDGFGQFCACWFNGE